MKALHLLHAGTWGSCGWSDTYSGTWDGRVLLDEIRATIKLAKNVLAAIQVALLFTEQRDAADRVIWPMQCAQSGWKEKNPPCFRCRICAIQLRKKKMTK